MIKEKQHLVNLTIFNNQVFYSFLAIKQLFEIGVFCCAKGDFLEDGQTIFKEQLKDPTVDTKPTCKCKGIKVESNYLNSLHSI